MKGRGRKKFLEKVGGGAEARLCANRHRSLGGADRLNPTEAAVAPGVFPEGFEQFVASEVGP
ncbi:MAG: hypothetical protein HW404_1218, partial [Anaerolineales bacterium]|nr:hypothetical protein [Anaerolineales bacterium]